MNQSHRAIAFKVSVYLDIVIFAGGLRYRVCYKIGLPFFKVRWLGTYVNLF